MLSNVKDYLIDLGLAVSHDKIKNSIQEKQVRERLEDFIQREGKYNYLCTTEEEVDFEALTDYLKSDLITDVRVRLCGTSAERSAAHRDIMSKVRAFARAKTKVGEKRAMDMVTKAMSILRAYYRSRINADLLFITGEITDQISENVEQQHTTQTQSLVTEMNRQREMGVSAISDMLQFSPERVVAEGIRMTKSGDVVEFDYVLFRTQEILDDGTTVVSNREQSDFPFMFTMKANLNTKCLTFTIALNNADNADTLKYVRFMKAVENGSIISVKSLELQEEFARGQLDDFQYRTDFDNIDEEVHFWEMVVAVEKHFDVIVDVPTEILDSQYRMLQYLYSLIIGDTNTVTWSTLALRMDLTEKLKADIAEWGDTKFALAYVGSVEVPLWEQKYELPIIRRYLCVKPKDLDRLKKKADVLDIGEEICLNFVPGDGEQGVWEDTLHHSDEEPVSDGSQLVP